VGAVDSKGVGGKKHAISIRTARGKPGIVTYMLCAWKLQIDNRLAACYYHSKGINTDADDIDDHGNDAAAVVVTAAAGGGWLNRKITLRRQKGRYLLEELREFLFITNSIVHE
jgi:hypothetical protein